MGERKVLQQGYGLGHAMELSMALRKGLRVEMWASAMEAILEKMQVYMLDLLQDFGLDLTMVETSGDWMDLMQVPKWAANQEQLMGGQLDLWTVLKIKGRVIVSNNISFKIF